MTAPTHDSAALLYDEGPCSVALVDAGRRLLQVNARFRALFGEHEGATCHAALRGEDGPCEGCALDQALQGRHPSPWEIEARCLDGAPRWLEARALPAASAADGTPRALLISLDVTRRRALERELAQAEGLTAVGLTVSSMAHAIKGMLSGLEGTLYTVSTGLEQNDPERLKLGWEMTQKYISQVSALVENLLGYARHQEPRREDVVPRALVASAIELVIDRAALVGVALEPEVADGLPPLWADPEMLCASLVNLISNAVDACAWDPSTDKAHRVKVTARPRAADEVCVEVEDNGMGVSAEHREKILTTSFSTKGLRGTGLGLLLTRKAIEAHGGSVEFDSTPGVGSVFRLVLPASATAAPARPPS